MQKKSVAPETVTTVEESFFAALGQFADTSRDSSSVAEISSSSKPGRKPRIDVPKLKALKDAGWKRKAVAEEMRCSLATVNKYWNS